MNTYLIIACIIIVGGCMLFINSDSIPKGVKAVENFDANRYLGAWYEIARFDYRFEKDMDNVIAQYSLKDNGELEVFNSGYNVKKQKWQSSKGSAKFRHGMTVGALSVTFFKPFYAGYNVVAIDSNYKYALVVGKNLNYIWFLSKEKTMPEDIKQNYLKLATDMGFNVANLIWVKQDKQSPYLNEK